MSPRVRNLVRHRAGFRCEYCHLPESVAELRFQIDHVLAGKHGGSDDIGNLAWSCYRCNTHKGPNLVGIDEKTGKVTPLFNPRTDPWADHFRWAGPKLLGRTETGRTTVAVLCINRVDSVWLRRSLMAEGIQF